MNSWQSSHGSVRCVSLKTGQRRPKASQILLLAKLSWNGSTASGAVTRRITSQRCKMAPWRTSMQAWVLFTTLRRTLSATLSSTRTTSWRFHSLQTVATWPLVRTDVNRLRIFGMVSLCRLSILLRRMALFARSGTWRTLRQASTWSFVTIAMIITSLSTTLIQVPASLNPREIVATSLKLLGRTTKYSAQLVPNTSSYGRSMRATSKVVWATSAVKTIASAVLRIMATLP